MKYLAAAIVYMGFFAAISFACCIANSATPLWALLLMPTMKYADKSNEV